jgi:hypothetical protein
LKQSRRASLKTFPLFLQHHHRCRGQQCESNSTNGEPHKRHACARPCVLSSSAWGEVVVLPVAVVAVVVTVEEDLLLWRGRSSTTSFSRPTLSLVGGLLPRTSLCLSLCLYLGLLGGRRPTSRFLRPWYW